MRFIFEAVHRRASLETISKSVMVHAHEECYDLSCE